MARSLGIVVFVDHGVGRSAANRGSTRVYKPFEVAAAHGLGHREGAPDVGGANRPAVPEGRAGCQVEDVSDAIQMARIMPLLGKKIAAQYLYVL